MSRESLEPIEREVLRALSWTGHTSHSVAKYFEKQGIRGVPRDVVYCPVSVFIRGLFGPGYRIRTAVDAIEVSIFSFSVGVDFYTVLLPNHVQLFIKDFDEGRYPCLIEQFSEHYNAERKETEAF